MSKILFKATFYFVYKMNLKYLKLSWNEKLLETCTVKAKFQKLLDFARYTRKAGVK